MEGGCRWVDFGQKAKVGVCYGSFGLWWVIGWWLGWSGKVEVRRVLGKIWGEFCCQWCGEFWGKVEVGSVLGWSGVWGDSGWMLVVEGMEVEAG